MNKISDPFLDDDNYGFNTLEKFLKRKEELSRPKKPGRKKKRNYGGRRKKNRYAIVEPNNYTVVRFFDHIEQLQNYTGLKNLYSRLYRYERYDFSFVKSPLINGYIVVRWEDSEVMGMDREQFVNFLHERARGWMVINQMDRIRYNIGSIDKKTLKRLFDYLKNVESLNSHKLTKDEKD